MSTEQQLTVFGAQPTATWAAGGGIWKLVCAPQRIDLYFDARGYGDITGGVDDPTAAIVCQRVVENLCEVPSLLQRSVNRCALVVTAQAAGDCTGTAAVRRLSKRLSNDEIRAQLDRGEVTDIGIRVNRVAEWQLADKLLQINRITGVSIDVGTRPDGRTETVYGWQLDVNTAPTNSPHIALGRESILPFYTQAEQAVAAQEREAGVGDNDRAV